MDTFLIKKNWGMVLFFILFSSFALLSQENKEPKGKEVKKEESKWDKLVFGGNIGLQIGTITYIEISPNVGYYFFPKFMSGIGVTYQYYKESGYLKTVGTSIYGATCSQTAEIFMTFLRTN